jgi:hypothetical protein
MNKMYRMISMDKLPNISDYRDISNIPYFLLGILIVNIVVLFIIRYTGLGGKSLSTWYDKFGLIAVIADVLIIFIVFILGQIIYTHFILPYYGWNPIVFILIVVFIQMIHVFSLYYFVILPIPLGHNAIIDMYKMYAEENSSGIIIGDALLMIAYFLVTLGLKYLPDYVNTSIAMIAIYTMTYILYTKTNYPKKY